MKLKFVAALLAGSAISFRRLPWRSQDPAAQPRSRSRPSPTSPTRLRTRPSRAQAVDDAQAKIELLQAQVEALQASIEQVKAAMVKTTPSWKGGPQLDDKDAGFSFKPKGLVQYDAGYVGFPRGNELRGTMSAASTTAISAGTAAPAV